MTQNAKRRTTDKTVASAEQNGASGAPQTGDG
jgi:hypothetical protein